MQSFKPIATHAVGHFARIQKAWAGETAVCIGGGASIEGSQIATVAAAHLRGEVRVVAINDAYLLASFADVLYFADYRWYEWHSNGRQVAWFSKEEVQRRFAEFAGQRICIAQNDKKEKLLNDPRYFVLRNIGLEGVSTEPDGIFNGRNSGYQALNVLALAGVKRILLLGFDCKMIEKKPHWFGSHPVPSSDADYRAWRPPFDKISAPLEQAGIEVINCSPGTALRSFRTASLNEALCAHTV